MLDTRGGSDESALPLHPTLRYMGLGVAPKKSPGAFLRTFSNCISEPVRVAIVTVLACPWGRFGWACTRLWGKVAGHMHGVGVRVRGLFYALPGLELSHHQGF